jgi:hypothetical protein
MRLVIWYILPAFCLFLACNRQDSVNEFTYNIDGRIVKLCLQQVDDSLSIIKLLSYREGEQEIVSTWPLPYPVFRFDCADINGDGLPEIAVGVVKATRFDRNIKKRLFVFKLFDTACIRPLWLGSQMPQPLIDFRLVNRHEKTLIRTIEQTSNGCYAVGEYEWKNFGPGWLYYIQENINTENDAKILLHKN